MKTTIKAEGQKNPTECCFKKQQPANCAHSPVAETDEMTLAPTQTADDVRKDMADSRSSVML